MKITVESDNGKIFVYDGAKAAFLTMDLGDGYKQLVDGAVSPEFVSAVETAVLRFTANFLYKMMKVMPEKNVKDLIESLPGESVRELMDMIENDADDDDEDAEEDTDEDAEED